MDICIEMRLFESMVRNERKEKQRKWKCLKRWVWLLRVVLCCPGKCYFLGRILIPGDNFASG